MLIKPRLGSSFRRLGLVPAAPFRAATSERIAPRRNPVMRPSSRKGEYAIPEINVWQKSTGNFHACTLALYHIYHFKSIEIKTFVCNILYYLVILIAIVYTTNLLAENISLIIYNL